MTDYQSLSKSKRVGIKLLRLTFIGGILFLIGVFLLLIGGAISMAGGACSDVFAGIYILIPLLPVLIICFVLGLFLTRKCDKKALRRGIIGLCAAVIAYPIAILFGFVITYFLG